MTAKEKRADMRRKARARGECCAIWEGHVCGKRLTENDRLDNVDGYCAECFQAIWEGQ